MLGAFGGILIGYSIAKFLSYPPGTPIGISFGVLGGGIGVFVMPQTGCKKLTLLGI